MERGVKVLVRILAVAALLGLSVILFHPDYRGTAIAMLKGEIEQSPIWESNTEYYREVTFEEGQGDEISE